MLISPPVRVRRSYRQMLEAPPERVFPLLCPVRERDWVAGWEPVAVYSESGLAEPDCVFTTPSGGDDEAIWVITEHDPEHFRTAFVKVVPGITASRISIALEPLAGNRTAADVTYQHTALGPAGEAFIADFSEAHYAAFMRTWEAALNHYLQTGRKREDPA